MKHAALVMLLCVAGPARAGRCPNVMLVLDRSGSMASDISGDPEPWGPSKWEILQQAVFTIVGHYGDQAPFGLELFTSNANNNAECYSDTRISVEPEHGTADQITMLVSKARPLMGGGTNTGEAIQRAAEDPVLNNPTRREFIILVTDG